MKIVEPSVEIIDSSLDPIYNVVKAGRICYKSEPKNTEDLFEVNKKFVKQLIEAGHESVLEHAYMSVLFITDRGISHEMVRHRISSFSQESSRFCNYSNNKFNNEISVILPPFLDTTSKYDSWKKACEQSEASYMEMIKQGCSPQIARSVLPTCLKTEVFWTANIREWRHVFNLRWKGTSGVPHPQIKQLMSALLEKIKLEHPCLYLFFEDIVHE